MPVAEAKLSSKVNVGTSSTVVVAANPGRIELTLVVQGTSGSDPVFLAFQTTSAAPTATTTNGVMLLRGGGSYTTSNFKGAIAAITTTSAVDMTVLEL